jgi:N-acetylglucosamine kinase-like BadF-type ATPase
MDLVEHALGAKAGTEASGIARRLLCERCGMNLEDVPRAFPAAERFRVASLAPIALEAYRTGDPAARAIVGKAVNDLVDLALRAKRNGELEGPVPVWLCGGLFASPAFRRLFETRLRKAAPLAALTYVEEPLLRILDLARGAARQPTPATCRP